MPVRAVVFDLFDTLVDMELPRFAAKPGADGRPVHATAERLHAALATRAEVPFERFLAELREVDATVGRERWRQGLEIPTVERFTVLAERLGLAGSDLPQLLTETHMGMLREHMATPAHHAGVLAELREAVPLALCSNFTHAATARQVLADEGLAPHLDVVVVSEDVGFRKPRREIFEAVLAGLGTRPEETLHVGDNLAADVAGAAALGIRTAWLTRRVAGAEARLEAHAGARPDFVIREIAEIAALLRAVGDGDVP